MPMRNPYAADNAVVREQWKGGQRHGKGKLTKVNGDGYNGMWSEGKPDMQLLKNVHRR